MAKPNRDKHIKFVIPVKPHLQVFLQDFYPSPYVLSQNDSIGLFLFHLLRRRLFRSRKYFSIEECTDQFELWVSRRYVLKDGCRYFHDYQAHLFNSFLDEKLMDHSITYISAALDNDSNQKEAIYSFIYKYELDSGSKSWYNKILKNFQRYRDKKQQKTA